MHKLIIGYAIVSFMTFLSIFVLTASTGILFFEHESLQQERLMYPYPEEEPILTYMQRRVSEIPPEVQETQNQHKILQPIMRSTFLPINPDLPTDESIIELYGDSSKMYGTEKCAAYREAIPLQERILAPAGLFNSGTNLAHKLLFDNCRLPNTERNSYMTGDRFVEDGVAWGKHIPAQWRDRWTMTPTRNGGPGIYPNIDKNRVLPIVVVKDPYTWMQSMCRHPYALTWMRSEDHCPNLVPNDVDVEHFFADSVNDKSDGIPVMIAHRDTSNHTYHRSMAHLWNDWYNAYDDENIDYPRLFVRYEDLLFRPEPVLREICACAGGVMTNLNVVEGSAKGQAGNNKGSSNLMQSLIRYGNSKKRIENFEDPDLVFAKDNLDKKLMDKFGYKYPEKKMTQESQ